MNETSNDLTRAINRNKLEIQYAEMMHLMKPIIRKLSEISHN